MMNRVILLAIFLISGYTFAQENSISVRPKNFKSTIAVKADLSEQTDLTIRVLDGNKKIKELSFSEVTKAAFKVDLKDLEEHKTYVIKVYNSKNELLYTEKIIKTLKF